jgi:NAD(P)-dependent dehydrogenase (short-subunit alcohol dehydrogenase family)
MTVPLTPETLAATSISDLISLKGRKAVVTGGARGMGEAIARRLAEAGADILIGDREADLAAATAANLAKTYGVKAKGVFLDVAQSKSVSELAEAADKDWGRIDVWVNCAGIQPGKLLVETTDEEWHAMNDVNLGGVFFGCREAAKRMVAVNNGVIINITSVCAYRGRPSLAHYCATKHGVVGMTQSMAMELGPLGVRVVCVSPGQTDTPGLREALAKAAASGGASDESFQTMMETGRKIIPLRRIGQPDDVARAVLFVASDMASFITATTVYADGGTTAF